MEGITFIPNFIQNPTELFDILKKEATWDESMAARKTASFGKAYNYSQMSYPYLDFIPELKVIIELINKTLYFKPNNCYLNYYLDGKSKMGFN